MVNRDRVIVCYASQAALAGTVGAADVLMASRLPGAKYPLLKN
jgi:hypothetical protein